MISRLAFVLLCAVVPASTSRADEPLIAYEGFDYPTTLTTLAGCDGGTGFVGPWKSGGFNSRDHGHLSITETLSANPGLKSTGHAVLARALKNLGGLTRTLATPFGEPGTTTYFSLLIEPGPDFGEGIYNGFFGLTLEPKGNQALHVGSSNKSTGMETRGGTGGVYSGEVPSRGTTMLLVVKCEFKDGNDKFTLYIDPTPGETEPNSGLVKSDLDLPEVRALTIYSTGSFLLDEIRVGHTFESVTPSGPVTSPKIKPTAPPAGEMANRENGTPLPLEVIDVDVTGAKIRLPYPKTIYYRFRSVHPEVFKQLVAQIDFPTHEILAAKDTVADRESVSFQTIDKSLSGAISRERFLAFCSPSDAFGRHAERQLTEIKASGLVLSEKQKAVHGLHKQVDGAITETVFRVNSVTDKPTLFLSTISFLHVKERAVMLTASYRVSSDNDLDAALREFTQWTSAIVEANKTPE